MNQIYLQYFFHHFQFETKDYDLFISVKNTKQIDFRLR